MSKNVLVGVNGLAREAENLWVGVDGKARKVKSAYVGVNGVARKFWPKIRYVWGRYTIKYEFGERVAPTFTIRDEHSDKPKTSYYGIMYQNVTTGKYIYKVTDYYPTVLNNWPPEINVVEYIDLDDWHTSRLGVDDFLIGASDIEFNRGDRPTSGIDWWIVKSNGSSLVATYVNYNMQRANTVYCDLSIDDSRSKIYKITRTPVRGTYIDQVFSDQPNTYPQNGQSGSYWYVYQGIQG